MSNMFVTKTIEQKKRQKARPGALDLTAAPPRTAPPSLAAQQAPGGLNATKDPADNVKESQLGLEYYSNFDDLEVLRELGSGNGGTVSKVRQITTGKVMARKVIHVEAKEQIRRRIVQELKIMDNCDSSFIIKFYGAFLNDNNDVMMYIEYMDVGSLDRISRDFGPIRVDVLGKIAWATLRGLEYLYTNHHIMHRDIKPSNILINSEGFIKLCDFGVSGELVNSIADTFVGTSTYMAPERIQGERYTVKSDVWSFGLTIMELAIAKFPFDASDQLSDGDVAPAGILDLLQQIVHEPAPRLPKSDAFPQILEDMIQKCMAKRPEERPTPMELLKKDRFIEAAENTKVDLKGWAVNLMEKHNRKSHLAPQLSPATQDLLRSNSPTAISSSSPEIVRTPTSGDIPIGRGDVRPVANTPVSRSSNQNGGGSVGRAGGAAFHPGIIRQTTTGAIYQTTTIDAPDPSSISGPSSADAASTFNYTLPIRPAPPAGPLPPPPVPRKEIGDAEKKENRRQRPYGVPPPTNAYGPNY